MEALQVEPLDNALRQRARFRVPPHGKNRMRIGPIDPVTHLPHDRLRPMPPTVQTV